MHCFRLMQMLPGRSPLGYGPGAGRWNEAGVPVIYASSVASLCFLELLCIRGPVVNASAWQLITLGLNEPSEKLKASLLPKNWNSRPHPVSSQAIGGQWVRSGESLALKVPSSRLPIALYPEEFNLLINPFHKDFSSVQVLSVEEISFEVNNW